MMESIPCFLLFLPSPHVAPLAQVIDLFSIYTRYLTSIGHLVVFHSFFEYIY